MAFRQLQVVLGLGRLVTGGDFAVGPIGLLQRLADALHFFAENRPGCAAAWAIPDGKGANGIDSYWLCKTRQTNER
jgi:hypothetical protein